MAPTYTPPPYSHNVALDLYEQMPFDRVSSTVKRLLVARWVNQGKGPADVVKLGRGGHSRFVKITNEEGFEVIQQLLMQADEAEYLDAVKAKRGSASPLH